MKKMVLSEYYANLNTSEKKEFRNQLMEKTGLSLPAFYDKRRNGTWNKGEQLIIALILGMNQEEIEFS